MKTKVVFIERRPSKSVSIEKVFSQIAKSLNKEKFVSLFQQLRFENDLKGTVKNLLFFRKTDADIYHITGHIHYIALVLPKDRTVLTVHDVGILYIRRGLRRYILKKILFDLPIKKLKYITAVSSATKNEIIKYTGCLPEKIRVIENPLREHFFITEKKEFNRTCPMILQIGTTYNKNLKNLIKALKGISCRLRIIGELSIEINELLEINEINFDNKYDLDDSAIRNEYKEADIVTFCSTFEGFGLPIIEAQAMLTPVVTSNLSPLKEVAGNFAALADPYDYLSIRHEIMRVIDDESYRKKLVAEGLENVKRFAVEQITVLYENLYQEMMTDLKKSR